MDRKAVGGVAHRGPGHVGQGDGPTWRDHGERNARIPGLSLARTVLGAPLMHWRFVGIAAAAAGLVACGETGETGEPCESSPTCEAPDQEVTSVCQEGSTCYTVEGCAGAVVTCEVCERTCPAGRQPLDGASFCGDAGNCSVSHRQSYMRRWLDVYGAAGVRCGRHGHDRMSAGHLLLLRGCLRTDDPMHRRRASAAPVPSLASRGADMRAPGPRLRLPDHARLRASVRLRRASLDRCRRDLSVRLVVV